ncbi:MAG: hypothetical protein WAM17_01505 [Rhodoplanes sp.]
MSAHPAAPPPHPIFLRRDEAANYLRSKFGFRCSKQTLAKLAVLGGGPVYRKAGVTPIYDPTELDRWARTKIGPPRRSTSEAGVA